MVIPTSDLIPVAETYARLDLWFIAMDKDLAVRTQGQDYYVFILAINNQDQTRFPNSEVVYRVRRDGAILSMVKLVRPGDAVGY